MENGWEQHKVSMYPLKVKAVAFVEQLEAPPQHGRCEMLNLVPMIFTRFS